MGNSIVSGYVINHLSRGIINALLGTLVGENCNSNFFTDSVFWYIKIVPRCCKSVHGVLMTSLCLHFSYEILAVCNYGQHFHLYIPAAGIWWASS